MCPVPTLAPRPLAAADLDEVVRIDAARTGEAKPAYWREVFGACVGAGARSALGLAVPAEGGALAGYLFGEVRAFEFGSEPCGWIVAVGIDEPWLRRGLASALLQAAERRFRGLGVRTLRTMVRRNDVPVLSFFRSNHFVGGPYVQLERQVQGDESA